MVAWKAEESRLVQQVYDGDMPLVMHIGVAKLGAALVSNRPIKALELESMRLEP